MSALVASQAHRGADVVIVGGGAIGVACAYELRCRGASVILLERAPVVARGASGGTAGLVTAAHAECLASPRALGKGVTAFLNRDPSFVIRPQGLPLSWSGRFLRACMSRGGAEERDSLLRRMALQSLALHRRWDALLDLGLRRVGVLNIWRRDTGGAARNRFVRECVSAGIAVSTTSRSDVAVLEPAITSVTGAAFSAGDACIDAAEFVRRLAERAAAIGAIVRTGVEVTALKTTSQGVELRTNVGGFSCGGVVVSNGVDARRFERDARTPIPLVGAKGYHVEFAMPSPVGRPVFLVEDHVVVTPLDGRLRLAGAMELGTDARGVEPRRARALVDAARAVGLRLVGSPTMWCGARPLSPDGMPVIGRSPRRPRVVIATGHGTLGITLAPITARYVADVLQDERPLGLELLEPARFL